MSSEYFLLVFPISPQKRSFQLKNSEASNSSSSVTLHESPIRIITQGQELTTDTDEKTLSESGFKENQVRFLNSFVGRVFPNSFLIADGLYLCWGI